MNIIKIIITDIKKDIKFIKQIITGTYKPPKHVKEFTKQLKTEPKKLLKTIFYDKWTWIIFLLFAMFWLSGYIFATAHYQQTCNEFIFKTFYNNTQSIWYNINATLNFTPPI